VARLRRLRGGAGLLRLGAGAGAGMAALRHSTGASASAAVLWHGTGVGAAVLWHGTGAAAAASRGARRWRHGSSAREVRSWRVGEIGGAEGKRRWIEIQPYG
jgi:hypothetical protein